MRTNKNNQQTILCFKAKNAKIFLITSTKVLNCWIPNAVCAIYNVNQLLLLLTIYPHHLYIYIYNLLYTQHTAEIYQFCHSHYTNSQTRVM
jgi:hypothetical protein